MLSNEELEQITKSKIISELEVKKIIGSSDLDAKKALAKRRDLDYESYLRLIQDGTLLIKDLSKRARRSEAEDNAITNGALMEMGSLTLEQQMTLAKSDDPVLKKVFALRRDLNRKTYDRLIISGVITPADLLSRPDMRPQEQLTVSDCELSESELNEFMAKPELTGDAWASLIQNEIVSTNDLLKRKSLTPAGQIAVCLTGSHNDKLAVMERPDLSPQTVTLLANLGLFERADGTLTPQFMKLAASNDYQVAFGKSYRRNILWYLTDMPGLCEKAFFAIANNHTLDPEYAQVKLNMILRNDCPIEIMAFYANLPRCLKRLDTSKDWDFKELLNVAALLCGDGIPLPGKPKPGKVARQPLGPRYREYQTLKLFFNTSTHYKNEKITLIPLWKYFTQLDKIVEMYKQGLSLEEIGNRVHVYRKNELLKEYEYPNTPVPATRLEKSLNNQLFTIPLPDEYKKSRADDQNKYKIDGVYRIVRNDKVLFAVINQFETLDGSKRRDGSDTDIVYYDIFADVSAPNDMANAGYTMLLRYEKFQRDPEEWRHSNFLSAITKYLRTTDPKELDIYSKDKEGWIKSHPGHPALDMKTLKDTYCLLPEPTPPTDDDFNVCMTVNELPSSQQFSLLSTFESWKPIFVGWSSRHFRITGPDIETEPIKSNTNIMTKICHTPVKKGPENVRE